MALKIGDTITNNPERADIARAIDSGIHDPGLHIVLDNGEDDHMEAVATAGGNYNLIFNDRGQRFHSAAPVDAETLRSIFFKYLDGDADWGNETSFIPDQAKGARARAANRISSKPPKWAILIIAGSFTAVPFLLFLLPESGHGYYDILRIALVVGGPMSVMLVAMIANKMLQLRRAANWPQAAGSIVKSDVVASHQQRIAKETEVINRPAIEYEFFANGRKYTGRRIGIGEDSGGVNTEATLARYPVGAAVAVYYDPADPENCVLERNPPSFQMQGCAASLMSLFFMSAAGYWLYTHFDSVVAPLWATNPGRIAITALIVGLLCLMAFLGSLIVVANQKGAPLAAVGGTVVESRTQSYSRRAVGGTRTVYVPVVEYAYVVNGHEFRSRNISDDDLAEDSDADAKKISSRYPKDKSVRVFYDPSNPGNATLEKPTAYRPNWIALAISGVSFAVVIYFGGIVHH
jgi:Protein of unknown function (DUF3592)